MGSLKFQSSRPHRRSRRRGFKRFIAPVVATLLMIGAAALWFFLVRSSDESENLKASPRPSEPAQAHILVRLPEDDAPHKNAMEWWYYNCHISAKDGREFSFHYVFFLVNSVVPYTASQVSLTDHQTGKRYVHQKQSPGNPSASSTKGFNFNLGEWSMVGSDGDDALKATTPDFAFDLRLSNPGPTVFQGGTGLLDFKQAGSSYYYSRPRMKLDGTLTVAGKTFLVTGESWFDHQWGNFQTLMLGWDWFSLQLEDGADIMLYKLRDRADQPVLFSGTYTRNGSTKVLGERDFSAQPTGAWKSGNTGITYNTAWKVSIPNYNIELQLTPIAHDSEIDARSTTLNTYWEGAINLSGSHKGRGFVEISPVRAKTAR